MAKKRMFTQKIIDSDAFVDMPLSTQALYFHLNMRADDDGFVNKPKGVQRLIGATDDDLKLLLAKRFIIGFESGVIVIKHWRMHNILRKDRYEPTQYQEEFAQLSIKDNGSYTEWQPNGNQMATKWQPSIDKISIDKISIDKDSIDNNIYKGTPNSTTDSKATFKPPTVEEVEAYCKARNNGIDAEAFVAFYESKGWMVGKNRMTKWKSAVITWERNRNDNNGGNKTTKRAKENAVREKGEDDTWFFNH